MTDKQSPNRRFWVTASLCFVVWANLMLASSAHAELNLATKPKDAGVKLPAPNVFLTVDDSGSMKKLPNSNEFAFKEERRNARCKAPENKYLNRENCYSESCPSLASCRPVNCYAKDVNKNQCLSQRDTCEAGRTQCLDRRSACLDRREADRLFLLSYDCTKLVEKSRMDILKVALHETFGKISNNSIRLAFQSLNGNNHNYSLNLRKLSDEHRSNFTDFVEKLKPDNGTPSQNALYNVHKYMVDHSSAAFRSDPANGSSDGSLACRRTFHIFLTDGLWKDSGANDKLPDILNKTDGDTISPALPDGIQYPPQGDQRRAYHDNFTHPTMSTLADWAFMMWATDYNASLANEVKPIYVRQRNQSYGSVSVDKYWNPRNNPMTWQGITTYTIGFGPVTDVDFDYNTLYSHGWNYYGNPLAGNISDNSDDAGDPDNSKGYDLVHMAINGRGRFLKANTGSGLTETFTEIIEQVLPDTTPYIARAVSNSPSPRADSRGLVSSYKPGDWSGDLKGYSMTSEGLQTSTPWSAAAKLNAMDTNDRNIFTVNLNTGNPVEFSWNNIGDSLQSRLSYGQNGSYGQKILNYIRGVRVHEADDELRMRESILGDIVNSSPWTVSTPNMGYTDQTYIDFRQNRKSRTEMVYVGSNDGMLHGFSTSNGVEKFAYIPRGSLLLDSNERDAVILRLTRQDYDNNHRFFVDGSPFSGDYYHHGDGSWRTVLIGSMGLGGRGFFAMHITNPDDFGASNILFDKTGSFTPSNNVGGLAAATWGDLGHMVTPPAAAPGNPNRITQITKLNNNRWAVLLGNGVNSPNNKASLLIQFLDGDRELVKIEAEESTPGISNGLSTPTAVDLNGDGTADVVYAGDLRGRLWKFDLSRTSPSNWKVAFSGNPLFKATSNGNSEQPIMTAPSYLNNKEGGLNLVFGTGRNVTVEDPGTTWQQTVYSVWDSTNVSFALTNNGTATIQITGGTGNITRSSLLQRLVTGKSSGGNDRGDFLTTTRNTSPNYTRESNTTSSHRGWYFDLPTPGERALDNSTVVTKSLVYVPSMQPMTGSLEREACNAYVKKAYYGLLLDGVTGLPYLQRELFDSNANGTMGAGDIFGASRIYMGDTPSILINIPGNKGEQRFAFVPALPGGSDKDRVCNTNGCGDLNKAGGSAGRVEFGVLNNSLAIGWRQLQ